MSSTIQQSASATTGELEVRPVAGHTGAEIHGVDLTQTLSDDAVAAIRAALLRWKVVFFRDQHITPAQHLAFGRRFGRVNVALANAGGPSVSDEYPDILLLDSVAVPPRRRELDADSEFTRLQDIESGWHSDVSCAHNPPMGSILRAIAVPDNGGDTQWTNTAAAYERLSEPVRNFVDGLQAVHTNRIFLNGSHSEYPEMRAIHPVIRVHPESGEKAIMANPVFTSHVVGVTPLESRQILGLLYRQLASPEFTVRFRWQPGSIAFWDNRAACHIGPSDVPPGTRRTMHRITLGGDVPVGPDGFTSEPLINATFE